MNERSPEFIVPEAEQGSPGITEAQEKQQKLFATIAGGDQAAINQVRKEYEGDFPDQLEGVKTLFELAPFFVNEHKLDRHLGSYKEQKDVVEAVTQFRFLLTHFILQNRNQPEFLQTFWRAAEHIARDRGDAGLMLGLRRSVLSQIAIMRTLEAMGQPVSLSHPKEDAFNAIDLWAGREAVQIKGTSRHIDQPIVAETELISFPAIQTQDQVFNSKMANDFTRFRAKLSEYGQMTHQDLKGFMVVVPHEKFDFVTGEPDPTFVVSLKEKLAELSSAAPSVESPEPVMVE